VRTAYLFPGQRIVAVELVRPLGVAGETIHGDPNQILRYRMRTGVPQLPPDPGLIHAIPVDQLGVFVLHNQVRPRRRLLIRNRCLFALHPARSRLGQGIVHLLPPPDDRPTGAQMLIGGLGEAAAGQHRPALDLADVRRRVPGLFRQPLLRLPSHLPPVPELRNEGGNSRIPS